jgi:hypothetical protein
MTPCPKSVVIEQTLDDVIAALDLMGGPNPMDGVRTLADIIADLEREGECPLELLGGARRP